MKVITARDRWELISSYDERMVPKSNRWRWDPSNYRWWTDDPQKVIAILRAGRDIEITATAKAKVDAVATERKEAVELSRAATANIEIPKPEGLEYMPFQKAGIQYALQRPNVLIADEMGLGKSIEIIGLINADESIKKVLVICPASLKLNWKREMEKWLTREFSIAIVNGKAMPEADILIINYDILGKHGEALIDIGFDLCVADECHYWKNHKAKRTKAGMRIAKSCKRIALLTGTPILNRPIELWTLIKLLDPQTWTNWKWFVKRYCNAYQTRWGWDVSGSSNLAELQQKLRETIMVRRLKADVLTELPTKVRQLIMLDGKAFKEDLKRERAANERWQKAIAKLKRKRDMADALGQSAKYKAAVEELRNTRLVEFTEMAKVRHDTAVAKAPAAAEYIKATLECVDKVVVFAHHKDVITILNEGLAEYNPVVITGATTVNSRQGLVDAFQEDPKRRVFIGNMRAAGVGITLTAASTVIFVELDWTPGNLTQAEDRCHRIGQKNSVLVQHIVVDDSLDAVMAKTLISKQAVADQVLDAKAAPQGAVVLPERERETLSEAGEVYVPLKTRSPEKAVPADEIPAIHQLLQVLAGMCDGARAIDGAGFNKFDSHFGKELASQLDLSPKQAWYGKRLIKKYHRQLPAEIYGEIFQGVSP